MQRRLMMVVIALTYLVIVSAANAQDAGNLLRDGGMEGAYTSRGRSDFNIPADWNVWIASSPQSEPWMNLQPVAFPHLGPGPSPQSGARALNMNRGFATFTAAIYQQVTVPENANLIGSAWGFLKTCNLAPGFDNCGSAVESGAFTRVGIDPTGGTDPNSPNIVWSGNALPHDRWEQMTVNATARGTSITVFIYVTQRWPSDLNNVYFDSAALLVGGAGGAAPAAAGQPAAAPPPPQTVPFVAAQGEQEDGSIVHQVQSGDTIDSIAVAYGVTRSQIMELNNITDPRIIVVGQELIIRTAEGAAGSETAEETPEAASAATGEPDTSTEPISTEEPAATAEAALDTPQATPAPLNIAALPPAPVRSASGGDVRPAVDPAAASGQVCVLMFEDTLQNRLQDADERLLPGGNIILIRDGATVAEHTTDGTEPHCVGELEAGDYVASVAAPNGYGLTTPDQLRIQIGAGTAVTVAFGAARDVQPAAAPADVAPLVETTQDTGTADSTNPILDNLGLVVLGAAGLTLLIGTIVTFVLRRR